MFDDVFSFWIPLVLFYFIQQAVGIILFETNS